MTVTGIAHVANRDQIAIELDGKRWVLVSGKLQAVLRARLQDQLNRDHVEPETGLSREIGVMAEVATGQVEDVFCDRDGRFVMRLESGTDDDMELTAPEVASIIRF